MVAIARPVMTPPCGWRYSKSWPSYESFSTRNMLSPRWPSELSGFERARTSRTPALPAIVHQVLAPSSIQPPSHFVALSRIAATSEPASGSVTATAQSGSPIATCGSHLVRCSSVPPFSSERLRISGRVIRLPAPPSEPRESSSVTTIIPMLSS